MFVLYLQQDYGRTVDRHSILLGTTDTIKSIKPLLSGELLNRDTSTEWPCSPVNINQEKKPYNDVRTSFFTVAKPERFKQRKLEYVALLA
jgi:hypothetical protein